MLQNLEATTSIDLIKREDRSNTQTTKMQRLSSVAGKNIRQLVWVTVGKTDHQAWLLGEIGSQEEWVLIQWESTRMIEQVPVSSIHLNVLSQRKRQPRTEINVSSFGSGRSSSTKQEKRKRSTSSQGDQEETEHSSNSRSRKKHRVKVEATGSKPTKKSGVLDGKSGVEELGQLQKAFQEESRSTSTGNPHSSLESNPRKADSSKSRSRKSLPLNRKVVSNSHSGDSTTKAGTRKSKSLSATTKDLVVLTASLESQASFDNSNHTDASDVEQSNGHSMLDLSMNLLRRDDDKARLKNKTPESVGEEEQVIYDSSDDDAEKERMKSKLSTGSAFLGLSRAKSGECPSLRHLIIAFLARAPGKYKVCFSLDGVDKLRKEIEEDVGLLLDEPTPNHS